MFILEQEDPDLFDRIQEQNLNRQYELLTNCIEIGLLKGVVVFDKYLLWALNHVAVANISQFGGRFRREPIYVEDHKPPHFNEVDDWMDRFISTVQEHWYIWSPTELAAYALWRLNWIHPFIEGNGALHERYAIIFCVFGQAHCSPGTKSYQNALEKTVMTMRMPSELQMQRGITHI